MFMFTLLLIHIITRKCGNCDALQLESTRQSWSALLTTSMPSFKLLNLSVAVLIAILLLIRHVTL